MRDAKPGAESSEYAKAQRAEVSGFVLAGAGAFVALVALPLHDALAGGVGCALAAVGAYLIAHTGSAYAQSRGRVKAAASLPANATTVSVPAPVVNVPASVTHVTATVKPRAGI